MNKERLISIVKNFSGKKVAVIGDIFLDNYIVGYPRTNPESDAPCFRIIRNDDYRIGGAGNAARNLASLEARVSLFGNIGEDNYSKILEGLCCDYGIRLYGLRKGDSMRKIRLLGARFNHPLIRLDFGENEKNLEPLTPEEEREMINKLKEEIESYEGILFSDYDKKILRGRIAPEIIKIAKERSIVTMVDPKIKNPEDIAKFIGVDIVKPNLQEARLIVGDMKGLLSYEELLSNLKDRVKSKYAVITCGKEGAVTYDGEYHNVPTKAREVSDVSGAGDTTAAALLLSVLSGAEIAEAMHIANYAAGIVVEKTGTASVTQEELIQRIKNDGQ